MDIHKYVEKKAKNLTELVVAGEVATLIAKRFDPETGEPLEPEVISLNKKELMAQKAEMLKTLDALNALIGDMDKKVTAK